MQNSLLLITVLLGAAASAQAAPLVSGVNTRGLTDTAEFAYNGNIENNDLLTTATVSDNGVNPDLGSDGGISDGLGGQYDNDVSHSLYYGHNLAGSALDSNPVVTFTLNTTANRLGYTLSSINSIYGWQNFPSITDQDYSIYYTTVFNSTPKLLATVAYNPFATGEGGGGDNPLGQYASSQVTITQLGSIKNVKTIEFAFTEYNDGSGIQNGQMIQEIDVNGVAAVPEPSTYAMLLAGLAFLGLCVRRKAALLK
jgi:hypothetical protein